jgi:lipid-A-disaccharide synthase
VLPKLKNIFECRKIIKNALKSLKPDLLILIDFPDFNLHIAGTAKKLNISTLYYISPQIWAWRSGRVKKIRKRVDHVAVILPFEEKYYKKHKVPVTFVGHPLLDKAPISAKNQKPTRRANNKVIGLIPGSRDGEVNRHLPTMLNAADILNKRLKDVTFYVSNAPTVQRDLIEDILHKNTNTANVKVLSGGIDNFLNKCDFVVAVSGTVTLEAAISGVPMIIIYKISWLSYAVARLLVKGVKNVGLANLVVGKAFIPELLQQEVTPEKIAEQVLKITNNKNKLKKFKSDLSSVRKKLGVAGASDRVANIAINMM